MHQGCTEVLPESVVEVSTDITETRTRALANIEFSAILLDFHAGPLQSGFPFSAALLQGERDF